MLDYKEYEEVRQFFSLDEQRYKTISLLQRLPAQHIVIKIDDGSPALIKIKHINMLEAGMGLGSAFMEWQMNQIYYSDRQTAETRIQQILQSAKQQQKEDNGQHKPFKPPKGLGGF